MPPTYRKHEFGHYPTCTLPVATTKTTPFSSSELDRLRQNWFKCITPLLRHMEKPEDVGALLSAFRVKLEGPSERDRMWQFIENIAQLFPRLIFKQIKKTIAATQGDDPRIRKRAEWVRKQLRKDLDKFEERFRVLQDLVLDLTEENEDERLVVLEHILESVHNHDRGKSIKTLLAMLEED